jgi:AraC-like DNA-binding protein
MNFGRIAPAPDLAKFVECYWYAESEDATPCSKKIIPDGYPEFVFHHGDPYRISLDGKWRLQTPDLVGGQLQKFFWLENSGVTGSFGITFKPTALTHLFDIDMQTLTNRVESLRETISGMELLAVEMIDSRTSAERIKIAEPFLRSFIKSDPAEHVVDKALDILRSREGLIPIQELCDQVNIGDRQLQRLFQRYVGLPPKFYARVIRFNKIFRMIRTPGTTWTDIVFASGYYDQSHFIRNFKSFTGEDPTAFAFEKSTLTNFFAYKS